jgi:hypothetical protein
MLRDEPQLHLKQCRPANMPVKMMFDGDDGPAQLIAILDMLNDAMAGIQNVKTVEELQAIIQDLNRVMQKIKQGTQ